MSEHEQFADDLALHALNALEGEDRVKLEQHLASCGACRLELEQLRGDGSLLALSTLGPKPPLRARQRLLDAVAKEAAGSASRAQSARTPVQPRRSWWGLLGWAATAAVIVFAASLWKENSGLKRDVSTWRAVVGQQTLELERVQKVARTITDPEGQRFTLVAMKTPAQPQGKAFYLRSRSSLVFVANNMPPLPPQKAYELWLIPMQGAPMPAGTFKPDARGSATVVNPPLPGGMEAKAFAITVENEAGAATPTMPIVMMGTGE
ncbi:MAG: anti-sigma factor [Candidatus Sulfotelmatobacter sp.]|jgi:anti-sigma-K factor RskA